MVENKEMPDGWALVKLSDLVVDPKKDLVDGPFGSDLKADEYTDTGVPVFKIQNIKANQFLDKKINYITKEKAKSLSRHSFISGDLIITKLGYPLGLCCKVPEKYKYGIIVADLMRLRPNRLVVYDQFLIYAINSNVVQNQFKAITKGTTRPRVNLTIVRDIELALPPLTEQHRIVAKIEELFSSLDKGIENLKTAQQQLKVYRQAVLKWAFEGKLTNKNVKDGELPEGWRKDVVKNIALSIQYGYTESSSKEKIGPKFLRITDIQDYRVNWDDVPYCLIDEEAKQKYLLEDGDLVFARTGATVGKSFLIKGEIPESIFASYLIRLRFPKQINDKYVWYYFQSPFYWSQIVDKQVGIGQPNVNGTKLGRLEIIIPRTLEEQKILVAQIESRLSVCDKIAESIEQSLSESESLRQSILKKAFEGKLVPQDPNDEPASKLLERIKAEKEKTESIKRSKH
jgi:type I restriction enzyme S subunit